MRELRLYCNLSKALRVEESLYLTVDLSVHRLVLESMIIVTMSYT